MISPDVVERAIGVIQKSGTNNEYFFDSLNSPEWIRPLFDKGFFQNPRDSEQVGDFVRFPFWPESRYLSRMVDLAPNDVLEIALQIPDTDNIRIREDLADIALGLPVDLTLELIPKAKMWINTPYHQVSRLPQKLGKLVSYLSNEGRIQAAIDLALSLLEMSPDPPKGEFSHLLPEPQAKFNTWEYKQVLERNIPDLMEAGRCDALALLCDLLESAISYSLNHSNESDNDNYLTVWLPVIEADNEGASERIDLLLVSAIRRTGESLIGQEGKAVLEVVEQRAFTVFKRLGLHLRRIAPNVDLKGTADLVSDPHIVQDYRLWHELFALLRDSFESLPKSAQESYLHIVTNTNRNRGNLSPEDELRVQRNWQYRRLLPIQNSLAGEQLDLFNELTEEIGEIERPDLVVGPFTTFVGPTSPIEYGQIQQMEFEELVDFLQHWEPDDSWTAPTPEGLGRELSTVVTETPRLYAIGASQFMGLDPTYVRSLLCGLKDALKAGNSFPWDSVLDLCKWVVNQGREFPERLVSQRLDKDPDWGWTRKSIADLLSSGFEEGEGELPFEDRETVWGILMPLTNDPDPTIEHESQYGPPNMNYSTLSINTVRGEAIHSCMRYAWWTRRNLVRLANDEEEAFSGFRDIPELRSVLESHLDVNIDPTRTIRAVFGQWLHNLFLIDSQWTTEMIPIIFPTIEADGGLRRSAWDSYLYFNHPYVQIFSLLERQYALAVEELEAPLMEDVRTPDDSRNRLADHLMAMYWSGYEELDDSQGLLGRFFSKAPDSVRAHALGTVGRSLHNIDDEVSQEILDRLKKLMQLRIEAARNSGDPSELVQFGWWFSSGKFEDEWAISKLQEVLKLTGAVEPDFEMMSKLVDVASRMPREAIETLRIFIEGVKEPWQITVRRDDITEILRRGLDAESEEVRSATIALIHALGARGHREFRNLLRDPN